MYLAVDIGGSKTLVATFSDEGKLLESVRFATPQNYKDFLKALEINVAKLSTNGARYGVVAMPGRVDRKRGVGLGFGNLPWENVPLRDDCSQILKVPIQIENDAKLAALSEAELMKDRYKKVLYVTFSTGIGLAVVEDGVIDTDIGDGGGNNVFLENNGQKVSWEDLVSGKAIVKKYGKRASEINDPNVWREISKDFALGIADLIGLLTPEVVVVGGGVGSHFGKFGSFLNEELKKYETAMLPIPPVIQAKRPEEAVLYGCFILAKEKSRGATA